jgi:uncharacterized protein YdcH (DUF465 family)
MFEKNQDTVQQLLETNKEFRYFYEQHESLDKRVDKAERMPGPSGPAIFCVLIFPFVA